MIKICEICENKFETNTISSKAYKSEALKCILVCSNCHKEIHSKLGYIY